MQINMSTVIANMRALMAKKITYSMSGSRTGTDGTGDCSGTVYASLNKAGAKLPIGNTDTMFRDLPRIGFQKVTGAHKYGDIFVWGVPGASSGAAGHTGIFLDDKKMINCNYGYDGVVINDYNQIWNAAGRPPQTFFRNGDQTSGSGSADAVIETNNSANMENAGEIEEYSYIGDQLCIKGWHFSSEKTKDSSGSSDGGSGGSFNTDWKSMQSRAQLFVSICTELGYPKNTTLALLANANIESSIDPSALEPNGMGHGYFQWSYASNWGDVPNHMKRTYGDAKYQLQFAKERPQQWINAGYGSWSQFWEGKQTPEFLTDAWVASWERPAVIGDRWTQLNKTIDIEDLQFKTLDQLSSTTSAISFATEEDTGDTQAKFGNEYMQIFDATNDKLLKTIHISLTQRPDIKKENPDVEGIEWSGFDFCTKFEHTNPFYVRFIRMHPNGDNEALDLQEIFFPHSSSRTTIGHDYCQEDGVAIIITDKSRKQTMLTDLIGGFGFRREVNSVPNGSFTIPITDVDKIDGNEDIQIIIRNTMFDGIVKKIELNKEEETATISVDHKIAEWDDRQIPKNVTVKNRTFPAVFCTSPFLYSTDWYINCDAKAQKEKINYAFSRQGHLEALTKACELTHDIFWRIGTRYDRYLEIGAFGEEKPYMFTEPRTNMMPNQLPIIGDVQIDRDFDNVFNVSTVYGEKSDSSQASLTLREAYLDQQRKGKPLIDGFPIVILSPTVNNEQKQYYTNITKVASNNSLEYAVLDEFGINLEQGKLIEKTVSFNDVAPFEQDNKVISDEERAQQSMIAYKGAVRRLQHVGRRFERITFKTGALPCDLNVLDKVWFDYSNQLELFKGCSRYCKKVYEASGYFYVESIDTNYDDNLVETNTISLTKEVHVYGDVY